MRLSCMGILVAAVACGAATRVSGQEPSGATVLALPGAPAEGVFLDYLAIDHGRHRVWVPAGGTGNVVVIDTKTQALQALDKFQTAEVERQGRKRIVGPSSATVGDGFVYVGNRADSNVCAIDASALTRAGCVTLNSSPDAVVYVRSRHEVWVTTPRNNSIVVLDVATPSAPRIASSFTLEGAPEGYAVDEAHGFFYTNLEDKDRTLRIDFKTHEVTANWMPACGDDGPKGLAIEPAEQFLVVACPDHIEVLDAAKDGRVLSKLTTGPGVDNIDYLAPRRSVFVAAAGAATLTVARLDQKGVLTLSSSRPTAKGARNAVITDDGVAYVADGPHGRILVVATGGN